MSRESLANSQILLEFQGELMMALKDRKALLSNGVETDNGATACVSSPATREVQEGHTRESSEIRQSKRLRTRRLVSQSDGRLAHSSQRHKVQVYPKSSFYYSRNNQMILNRAVSRRRSYLSKQSQSVRCESDSGRRIVSRLEPVTERKDGRREGKKTSLVTDASIIENRIYRRHKRPLKSQKQLQKASSITKFSYTPLSEVAENCTNMIPGKFGSMGMPLELSQAMAIRRLALIDTNVCGESKDEKHGDRSPKLERLKQQLPLFLSSGSPPSTRKGMNKRIGSPGNPNSGVMLALWKLQEPFVWGNLNGQRVEISEVDLLSLSESECIALQKVAEQRLRDIDLGVSITVPKDESKHLHGKNNISVLRRAGVHLSGTKNKSKKEPDHVFAIPLVRVVENDQLLRLQTVEQNDDAFLAGNGTGNDNDSSGRSSSDSSPKTSRRISSSLDSYADQNSSGSIPSANESGEPKVSSPTTPPNGSPVTRKKLPGGRKTLGRRCAVGLNTDTEIDAVQSKLLESLMISETSTKDKKRSLLPPTMPQVPYVVQKCCAHILKHGLDVTGIFRIAGSKKRVKQLRQEFDHGVDVKIDEDYHAHDVAALLKEFFRDLPEALLTRELYQAFISTAKLPQPQRLDALRSLVWLLPMPNRDTLQQLLSFLATVAEFSEDRLDATGKTVTGNKMGVANLSVIFGPNILHRYKKNPSASDQQFQVQSLERAEESTYVIKIVDDMIRSQKDLFVIPRETHDEILRTLQESDPDAVDFLLRRKAANYAKSPSPKFPSDNLDTPSDETAKSFPAPPLSDMNNNNKNGNNSSTALAARYRPQTDSRYAGPGASNFTLSPPQRAPSNSSSSKTNHSVTFTEDDMKEILKPEPTTANPEKSLLSTQASAQSCAQSKTSSPRPQGLAVSQEAGSPKSPTKTGIRHRTKAPSPIALRSATGSSTGLEDCSSASNESLSTARPPTPKQRKNIRVRMVSNPDLEVCSDSETPVRRSQGRGSPRFPLHTLKLSRPAPPAEPHSENVVEISDLTPKTYGRGRRVSKDDLYLSQQLRRRLQRQQSVVI